MNTALESLLRECTVLLRSTNGKPVGSGFFVAEGQILTAAHVVDKSEGTVEAVWRGETLGELKIEWREPSWSGRPGRPVNLPDMALLGVQGKRPAHPCVMLSDEVPSADLLAEGFTAGVSADWAPDAARLVFETLRPEMGFDVIRLKDSIIDPGLSGGPLLDVTTGRVVGITKSRRTMNGPVGGVGVHARALRDRNPETWRANTRFHQSDRRWEFARLCDIPSNLEEATQRYLGTVRLAVDRRPGIRPPGEERTSVLQPPSVRPLSGSLIRTSNVRGSESDTSFGAKTADGVFRWAPLRAQWSAAVLTGLPGAGKSYLLNMHVDALAENAIERAAELRGDHSQTRIPALVDCAALGAALREPVTAETALAALVETVRASADLGANAREGQELNAVLRLAHADGRLITCLDALDETGGRDRQLLLKALPYLAERGNSIVVTSRPQPTLRAETAGLRGCFRGEVVGFSRGQVFSFVRAWFSASPQLAARMEEGLRERAELRDLATLPLVAALLCGLVLEGDDVSALPTSPSSLYRAVVLAALAGHWRATSGQALPTTTMPNAELRLALLSTALGKLTSGWRSRLDHLDVHALDAAMAEVPEYGRVRSGAESRFAAWRDTQPHPVSAPASAVLWELLFDGLLAYDHGDGSESRVRFAHPVLGEYCLAAHIASLPEDALTEAVRDHQWLDGAWEQVWPLASGLMDAPDALIRIFLDTPADAWFEQTFLAASCVAGGAALLDAELVGRVVDRVVTAARSTHALDRDRAHGHLTSMIRLRLPPAVEVAREIVMDEAFSRRIRMRLTASLVEIGDEVGAERAYEALRDRTVPAKFRGWIARSIVLAGTPEGLDAVQAAIRGARSAIELNNLVAAMPMETSAGADLAMRLLGDHTSMIQIRAAVGRAIIALGDLQRIAAVKKMVTDPVATVWTLRAELIAELLAAGEDDLIAAGHSILQDPSISNEAAIHLSEVLIHRGEVTSMPKLSDLLNRRRVAWKERQRLARALAELGPPGIQILEDEVASANPIDLKLRSICALVEVGLALDVAHSVVADVGTPGWIRSRLATQLLQAGDTSIDPNIIQSLLGDPNAREFHAELAAALARSDAVMAASWALRHLEDERSGGGMGYRGSQELVDLLPDSGVGGSSVLQKIASAATVADEDRALALIALAGVEPVIAGGLTLSVCDDLDELVASRLVIILAQKGVIEVADRVAALIPIDPEAYSALYKLLSGPRTSQADVLRLLPFGSRAGAGTDSLQAESTPNGNATSIELAFDGPFLEASGVGYTSEVELDRIRRWLHQTLELRVGEYIAVFLGPDQIDEFAELSSEEEELEFLTTRAARYPEMVRRQFEGLQQDLKNGDLKIPDFLRPDNLTSHSGIWQVSHVSAVLVQWFELGASGEEERFAAFLHANLDVITSDLAADLLRLAEDQEEDLTRLPGLRYVADLARTEGFSLANDFILDPNVRHDRYALHLADNEGVKLFLSGLAGSLLDPSEASSYFYAALGAAIDGHFSHAVLLLNASRVRASEDQTSQGCTTLATMAAHLGWSDEQRQELLKALNPAEESKGEYE